MKNDQPPGGRRSGWLVVYKFNNSLNESLWETQVI